MPDLETAIVNFVQATQNVSDADLERPWSWQDYDEGIRFAFFRTYEEVRELAARLRAERTTSGPPLTIAERILAQYHAAFRDLQAVLVSVDDQQAELSPGAMDASAEQHWSIRQALNHIIQAERTFYAINDYGLRRARSQTPLPPDPSDEDWEFFWAGDPYEQIKDSQPFSALMDYYQGLHARVLEAFVSIRDEEMSIPVVYWESKPMQLEFRLHRFDSHLRQHTIQIEKTLAMLGRPPTEARRLLRLVFAALAELEGALLGSPQTGIERRQALAEEITRRSGEIARVLAG